MIKSLDELVTDIEDTSAYTQGVHQQSHLAQPAMAGQHSKIGLYESDKQKQQQSQPSIDNIMADVSRQLSERFDLHDEHGLSA